MICNRRMDSLGVSVCRLLALVLFVNAIRTEEIDWDYEAARNIQLFYQEYDDRLTHKLVQDIVAPGFVLISQKAVIEGDFDALEEQVTRKEHKGHAIMGRPQFVSKCGNKALAWGNMTFFDKQCNGKDGTYVILFEHLDGMAKTKLYHPTADA